jgi:putative flavoprotein involved in K+ transport
VRTAAVVIGAGHAGLAMSRRLTERSVEHVVLDRGDIADSWQTKRWPGLRLLTPNWMLGLPGQPAEHENPDGFMTAAEVADLLGGYARRVAAPVRRKTTLTGQAASDTRAES